METRVFGTQTNFNDIIVDGPWISYRAYEDINAAATAAAGKTLLIDSQVDITTNTTIGTTVNVVVINGGSFSVSGGVTLTMPTPQAGLYTIFSGAGTVNFNIGGELFPQWWGGLPDGVTDSSAAWQSAITEANRQVAAGVGGNPITVGVVKLSAGDWIINTGASIVAGNVQILGEGNSNTRVQIGSGQVFLTVTSYMYQFELRGITFSGGLGVLHHTSTGTNVSGLFKIKDCAFFDYTGTCIGTLSTDMPNWHLKRNTFRGAVALTSKGFVHSGLSTNSKISGNSFERNRYHIKLLKSGDVCRIEGNDFIQWTNGGGSPKLVDIWIVGDASYLNGSAVISRNKFGNENEHQDDYIILVADEGSGTNTFDKNHATSVSTGYLNRLQLTDNTIDGASSNNNGIVYSYTERVRGLNVARNTGRGGVYPFVLHIDPAVTITEDRIATTNNLEIPSDSNMFEQAASQICNIVGYSVFPNRFNLEAGKNECHAPFGAGWAADMTDLWTTASSGARLLTQSNTTRVNINDSTGGADGATYTFTTAAGFCYGALATPTVGRLLWIEFEVKKASAQPLAKLEIRCTASSGTVIFLRRYISLPDNWQRIRIPVAIRDASTTHNVQFRAVDYSVGVADQFDVGRISVYHAAEPVNLFPSDNTAAGAGTDGTISSRSANPLGECDGFTKMYREDGTLCYVPYWLNIAP